RRTVCIGESPRAMAVCTVPCPPAPSDERLLARFAAGGRCALGELFARYRNVAYRVAYRLLGDEADALEAVQEGVVKDLSRLGSFQGRSRFKTWLLRVVSNAALDFGRQRGRRAALRLDAPSSAEGEVPQLLDFDDPAQGLERADLRRLLDQALASLPEAQ